MIIPVNCIPDNDVEDLDEISASLIQAGQVLFVSKITDEHTLSHSLFPSFQINKQILFFFLKI